MLFSLMACAVSDSQARDTDLAHVGAVLNYMKRKVLGEHCDTVQTHGVSSLDLAVCFAVEQFDTLDSHSTFLSDSLGGTSGGNGTSRLSAEQLVRVERNRNLALRRRTYGSSLNVHQLLRIHDNRAAALRRRSDLRREEANGDNMRPFQGIGETSSRTRSSTTYNNLRLERQNAHPRDARIVFYEEEHYYVLDDTIRFPLSVSGVSWHSSACR